MDKLDIFLHYMITMTNDITFMHCDFLPNCRARVDKVFKGYVAVQMMEAGRINLSYDDEAFELDGAWVWTSWPGPHIKFEVAKGAISWRHRYVAFRGRKARDLSRRGLFPYRPVKLPQPDGDVRIFDELLRYAVRTDNIGKNLAAQHLELFLTRLKDRADESRTTDQIEHEVRFRLQQESSKQPDYGKIAADLGMAESTLRRRFHRATGKAVHTFFIEEKIGEARTLLRSSQLSIKEISEKLGYSDVFYFTRQFRKYVGTPPSTFRNSIQR